MSQGATPAQFTSSAALTVGAGAGRAVLAELGRPSLQEALSRSWSAARACGVTRLADITRLDFVGTPVFQAIRPMGRALSVHQGKGLTVEAAKISALMEAVESDHAEAFAAPVRTCAFEALPPSERAADLADLASNRDQAPEPGEALDWVEARRLRDGGRLWVPFEFVSLDFTWRGDPRIERSSNGLGWVRPRGARSSKACWRPSSATLTRLGKMRP